MNSREKGKRGERQWRDVLRAEGFHARRGQQYAGGADSPDVVCEEPLTLCINQDFGLLRTYMDGLLSKKADEQRMEEKKTKYISHVAYHLYQMSLHKDEISKQAGSAAASDEVRVPNDEEMQLEINRVASTLIRLMEVMR